MAGIVVSLAVLVGGEYGLRLEQARIEGEQHDRVVSKVGELRAALEGELNSTLYLTNGLTAYVLANARLDGTVAQSMLKALHTQGRNVRNIGLAPGNRLTYVYPITGNQSAIGLYYPDLPEQWPAIKKAIQERKPILAGPLELKQGGEGFIYRVPVFNSPHGDYWGILSMVIDAPGLLAQAGIAPVIGDLRVAIRGVDGLGEAGKTFLGDPALFADDSVKATIHIPNGSWQIAARPVGGWEAEQHIVWWRVSLWAIAFLLGVLVYNFLASYGRLIVAERRVRADHDELNEAQRIAGLGSWVIHLRDNRLEWSDEAHRIFGVPAGTPLTLDSFVERLHPDDRDAVLAAWQDALRGAPYDIEHRIVVNGAEKWVRERAVIQFDGAGAPEKGMGTVLDITSRKLAEQARNEAEERFRLFMDHSPAVAWVKDQDGKHIFRNRAYDQLFGGNRETWYGKTDFEIWPERVAKVFRANDLEVLKLNRPVTTDEPAVDPDGNPMIWSVVKFPFQDAGGHRYVAGFGVDVTEQRKARRLLAESEGRLNEAQRIAHLGNWDLNLDTKTMTCSDEMLSILEVGLSPRSVTLDSFQELMHPDDRQSVISKFEQSVHEGTAFDIVHRLRMRDGRIKYVHQRAEIARSESGERSAFVVGTVQDVTAQQKVATELEMAKMRLSLALDASELSTWDFDIGAGLVSLDERWLKTVGMPLTSTSIRIESLMSRLHQDDVGRVSQSAIRVLKGEVARFEEELRFQTDAGDWKWIRCSGLVAERDATGRARRAIGTNLDISDRKAAEEKIRQLAYYDSLTNLPNRRLLLDRFQQALVQARRHDRSMAVMFLDLDNFKSINDTLGHDAGDQLLRQVADRLRVCIRTGDTISRQGGDEFVIVLAEVAQTSDASKVAQKIIDALAAPVQLGHVDLKVTTSIGISVYHPRDAAGIDDLMKRADAAMYDAKKAGRNRYCFFSEDASDGQ